MFKFVTKFFNSLDQFTCSSLWVTKNRLPYCGIADEIVHTMENSKIVVHFMLFSNIATRRTKFLIINSLGVLCLCVCRLRVLFVKCWCNDSFRIFQASRRSRLIIDSPDLTLVFGTYSNCFKMREIMSNSFRNIFCKQQLMGATFFQEVLNEFSVSESFMLKVLQS